jgi:hypothetical protein
MIVDDAQDSVANPLDMDDQFVDDPVRFERLVDS